MLNVDLCTIDKDVSHEIVIERSRFITHLFSTKTVEKAQEKIQQTSKKYYDATHNCTAYIIGNPIRAQKTNDNGEPKGTAGMPMLHAMTQRNLTDVTAVVTRYFGGIKLGAGGLIRAYSQAVTETIHQAVLMQYQEVVFLKLSCAYEELQHIYYLQEKTKNFQILSIEYKEIVEITLGMDITEQTALEKKLTEDFRRIIKLLLVKKEICLIKK